MIQRSATWLDIYFLPYVFPAYFFFDLINTVMQTFYN